MNRAPTDTIRLPAGGTLLHYPASSRVPELAPARGWECSSGKRSRIVPAGGLKGVCHPHQCSLPSMEGKRRPPLAGVLAQLCGCPASHPGACRGAVRLRRMPRVWGCPPTSTESPFAKGGPRGFGPAVENELGSAVYCLGLRDWDLKIGVQILKLQPHLRKNAFTSSASRGPPWPESKNFGEQSSTFLTLSLICCGSFTHKG